MINAKIQSQQSTMIVNNLVTNSPIGGPLCTSITYVRYVVRVQSFYDNPAGRLAVALRAFQRDSGVSIGTALGIPEDDDSSMVVILRMAELERITKAVRRMVQELPEDEDPQFLLRPYVKVEEYVSKLIRNTLNNFSNISAADMASRLCTGLLYPDAEIGYGLESISRALRRHAKEPSLSEEQLAGLIGGVRELVDSVLSAEALTDESKLYLIARLREIESALLASRLTGFTDLEAAVDRFTGTLVRRPDIREPGLMSKISTFFQSLVQVAAGTSAIAGATTSTIAVINALASVGQDPTA